MPVFLQHLAGFKTVLEKGEAAVTARKLDPTIVLNQRFYPDMFTLARQVRQASEHALGAGRAAGVEVPKLPDLDNSFAEMQSRIDKTVDFLKTLKPAQLDGKEDSQISVVVGDSRAVQGAELPITSPCRISISTSPRPNLLRQLGVEIGKRTSWVRRRHASAIACPGGTEPPEQPVAPRQPAQMMIGIAEHQDRSW